MSSAVIKNAWYHLDGYSLTFGRLPINHSALTSYSSLTFTNKSPLTTNPLAEHIKPPVRMLAALAINECLFTLDHDKWILGTSILRDC